MRVRLQYSSNLEDTPLVMSNLLRKQVEILIKTASLLEKSLDILDTDPKYTQISVDLIDDVRKQMNDVDLMLNDCCGILQGYITVTNKPEVAAQPQAAPPAPQTQATPTRGSWIPETKTYNPPKANETESE
jgi:Ran GTPase-activating protein (RanGAP) involved in mRNA processing and transport